MRAAAGDDELAASPFDEIATSQAKYVTKYRGTNNAVSRAKYEQRHRVP